MRYSHNACSRHIHCGFDVKSLRVFTFIETVNLPSRLEKVSQQHAGFGLNQAADDFRLVVARRLLVDTRSVLDPARFWIVGAKVKPANAS